MQLRTRPRPSPRPRRRGPSAHRRSDALSPKERRQLLRLLCSGGIFVLLVAAKLLLPGNMAALGEAVSQTLRRSVDVTAVFSAVGELLRPEGAAEGALGDLYQAVFQIEAAAPEQTAAVGKDAARSPARLRQWGQRGTVAPALPAGEAGAEDPALSFMDLVLYADEDLPENVSMRQTILGFDHQTPVVGAASSGFGFRDHPTEGAERFHYGLDLAAEEGTAITCFADGTVAAVGQSSSYGKYCIVTHENGCTTLYAHCSRISVSPGETVKRGQTLAAVGQTGMATGPHLHFEVQKDGVYLNPIYYVETA